MISSYGYPCESHQLITKDGYILTLHRIPGPSKQKIRHDESEYSGKSRVKAPVVLGHSVVGSSAIWSFAPNHSLAYRLADEGTFKA